MDDEPNLLDGLREILAGEGYVVETAANGDDGFWMATENDFDLLVLDLMMPGRNGFVLCRDLRAAGFSGPILVLTAKQGEFDEAEALDAGADDYLRKPFSATVLVARVRALGRRSERRLNSDVVEVGDVQVHLRARTCVVLDREVSLTAREFTLLEVLAREPGAAVSKADLIAGAWGSDHEGADGLLQVYIGYLRKKLDVDRERSCISTITGHGYRLDG